LFLIIFSIWQNGDLVYSDYIYETGKIDEDLDGYKIIQISDLHNARFGNKQKRLLNIIKNASPNMIVVTGDLVVENTGIFRRIHSGGSFL